MAKNGHFIIKYKSDKPVMIRIGHAGVTPSIIKNLVNSEAFLRQIEKNNFGTTKKIIGKSINLISI